ncbi:MAG: hypothetical protein ACK5PP_01290 [Acidimicrobiales bacterium]
MNRNHHEPAPQDGPGRAGNRQGRVPHGHAAVAPASFRAGHDEAIDAAIGRLRAAGLVDPEPPAAGVPAVLAPDGPFGPDHRGPRNRSRVPARPAAGRLVTAWTDGVLLADAG